MIGIPPKRKLLPYLGEPVLLQGVRKHFLLPVTLVKYLPKRIDDHRIAAVIDIIPIIPYPVDANDERLVLDRPGM